MNSNTIVFEDFNVKNLNARIFTMFYIDDMTSFASIFISKSLLEFENFLKVENEASMTTQTKEKSSKKKKKENLEKMIKESTNE